MTKTQDVSSPRTITQSWLTQQAACTDGKAWVKVHANGQSPAAVVRALMAADHRYWANWLIVRVMTYPQYVAYAIFAAEQVLDLYERQFPDDARPRHAIDAAKRCLTDRSGAAAGAARAAGAAAEAARAAGAAWAAWGAIEYEFE